MRCKMNQNKSLSLWLSSLSRWRVPPKPSMAAEEIEIDQAEKAPQENSKQDVKPVHTVIDGSYLL